MQFLARLPSHKSRLTKIFIAGVMTVVLLAACATETGSVATSSTPAPTEPTTVPTATPIPYQDFAGAVIPPANPERLAQLTSLLTLVPESFGSAIYLDTEFLRSNETLADLISPEALGMEVALPSFATGVVNTIAVATDPEDQGLLTPFQSNFQIGDLLKVAGGFGLQLGDEGPTSYEGHDVWNVNLLGTDVAMATAEDTTGVSASGRGLSAAAIQELAESSLDSFDGRAANIIGTPGLTALLSEVPSGFAAAVLSRCDAFPLINEGTEAISCTNVAVSADILPGELVVIHGLIGFIDQATTTAAMQVVSRALENQRLSQDFVDLGVRQEGENLRVRVIVDVKKFGDAFKLFAPSK